MSAGSVEEVLEDLGVKVISLGKEISARCPFHPDNHPSFSMNATTGSWTCFSCGEGGSLAGLVKKLAGSNVDPKHYLSEIKFQRQKKITKTKMAAERSDTYLYAQYESFGEVPDWALEERNIDAEAAHTYGLKWNKGWIIPIWNPEAESDVHGLWGWQFKRLREFSNYPSAIKKSHALFGLRELQGYEAVLVESPLDVVRLSMVSVPAVASFGALVSKVQIQLLIDHLDSVTLALDNDDAGHEATQRIHRTLEKKLKTTIAQIPPGHKDPGTMNDRQLLRTFDAR